MTRRWRRRLDPALLGFLWLLLPSRGLAEGSPAVPQHKIQWGLNTFGGKLVPGGFVRAVGWAAEAETGEPVALEFLLDGGRRGDVWTAGYRPDVAEATGRSPSFWSGFLASVSLRSMEAGTHTVQIFGTTSRGERVLLFGHSFTVREGPQTPWVSRRRLAILLFLRTLLFFVWLSAVGAGIAVWFLRHPFWPACPGLGLAAAAIAVEWGGQAGLRPLEAAGAVTAMAAVSLAVAATRRRLRIRRLSRTTLLGLVAAALFVLGSCLPLVSHGKGAVLGTITDAPWEISFAESLARWDGRIPEDVDGHLRRIPLEWRRVGFRGGSPYLFAIAAPAFGVDAHEAHSPVVLGTALVLLLSTAALAGRLWPAHPLARTLAVLLAAASPVLVAELYHQHAGVLIAAALFVTFLFHLFSLARARRGCAILPAGILLGALATVYPESAPIWTIASLIAVAFSGRRAGRTLTRLLLVAVLAAVVNPLAVSRAVRFGIAQLAAPPLATPQARQLFGDTHLFPPLSTFAGLRPYRRDLPAPRSALRRVAERGTILAGAVTALMALPRFRRRHLANFLVLAVSPVLLLAVNRYLEFPYGYSKALLHGAVLSGSLFALIVAAMVERRPRERFPRAARLALVGATSILLLGLSSASSASTVLRFVRAVPGYDPAWTVLPALASGLDRRYVIVTGETDSFRREWVAYFLGEYFVYGRQDPIAPEHLARPALLLVDKRDGIPIPRDPLRQNDLFALVPFEHGNAPEGPSAAAQ